MKEKAMDILVFTNDTSSPKWRFEGVARHFNENTQHAMYITSWKNWNHKTLGADIVILEMLTSPEMVRECQAKGAVVIFEADDAYIDTYKREERKNLQHMNDKWREQAIETIKLCDAMTVTNHVLKENFARYTDKPIYILPNFVDFEWYGRESRLPIKRATNEIRIGWFGSKGHYEDLRMVVNAINRVIAKHPNVKFVYQGYGGFSSDRKSTEIGWGEDVFKEIPRSRREFFRPVDAEYWPEKMRLLDLDIGLAPLIDDWFNHCKSHIKWMEYAITGSPSVVSPTVYTEHPEEKNGSVVEHGKTAFVATTEDEWFEYICKLVEDEKLRKDMAAAARKVIEEKWDLANNLTRFEKVYKKACAL
jgi:glycosyltransferase involved in cell wall biosynthesis